MTHKNRQLEWSGWELPPQIGDGWEIACTFKIGNGMNGYYNVIRSRISRDEFQHGDGYILARRLREMIHEVRKLAYRTLCNNSLQWSLGEEYLRIKYAEEAQYKAEERCRHLEAKAAQIQRLLKEVGGFEAES